MFEFHLPKDLKKRRMRLGHKEDIEFHEILLDSLAQKRKDGEEVFDRKMEVLLLRRILRVFFIFCCLVLIVLFAKAFQLQVLQNRKFAALADENKFVFKQTQSERGVIYDANMKQLVFNQPSFDLVVNINNLPKEESQKMQVLKEVGDIIKQSPDDLKKEIDGSKELTVSVLADIPHDQLVVLESKIGDLTGFQIQNNPVRSYPDGEFYSHIIGYTGKITGGELKSSQDTYSMTDYVGRAGLEKSYEDFLKKNPGKVRIERNVRGEVVSKEIVQPPESGNSLVLWLDSDLQKKIQNDLANQLHTIGGTRAAAVALNPKTGGVLAMVSLPSFDNNLFQKGADAQAVNNLLQDNSNLKPLFNRVIAGKYLTGSIIKPLLASAALQEKVISPDKKISGGPGYIEIPNKYNPSLSQKFRDWTIHDWSDMRKAIAESNDIYFYTIGGGYKDQAGLGPSRIKQYLDLFGWDQKTQIDIPGEAEGFVPDKQWKKLTLNQGWWDGDTYNLSIGQGYVQITPLEVAASFAAIANGGKLLEPEVVQKIIDTSASTPKTIKTMEPKIIRENFIDSQNLQVVREGMRQAVDGENSPLASSITLNSLPVKAAAKTGTAELGKDHYNNWVTVYAPYDDPQIVLTIMTEDITGVRSAVLPVAKSVLEWYFTQDRKN